MRMPESMLGLLREILELAREDLVPGGRYHNLSDFMAFPNPGIEGVEYEPMPPLEHPAFAGDETIFQAIGRRDSMIHLPYHSYRPVIRFIRDAAADPDVRSIRITLYRVASGSQIVGALVDALANGKEVVAFLEVKARFDEESNFRWAEELERAGARVLYSFPGMKVHSKICLVERHEPEGRGLYAYLGTGNFNEKTARFYGDHGLFTADIRLTSEVERLFGFLEGNPEEPRFEHLLVAPFNMRERFIEAIDIEIAAARRMEPAEMILKMNSLEDPEMIRKLYEAADAGVRITLIVRGICSLMAGRKNIRVTSIVDRYLEHARVYIFHNGGQERMVVASADWMTRNLSRRVEVGFPIYDAEVARELRAIIDLQLADNTKSRVIGRRQSNKYRKGKGEKVRAQTATYEMLRAVAVGCLLFAICCL
jgi:polyphosphate kinase